MTEKLKYKVGDKVLISAVVNEVGSDDTPYKIFVNSIYGGGAKWVEQKELLQVPTSKPKITQAVMDWYEETENEKASWYIVDWLNDDGMPHYIHKWLYGENHLDNQHALATLIAYGPEAVEIEKKKRYRVKVKGVDQYIRRVAFSNKFEFHEAFPDNLTKQELIDAGFEGVFNNPMFEVEEVE